MVIPEERTTAPVRVTVLATVQRVGSVAEVMQREKELNDLTSRGDARSAESFYTEDFMLNGPGNRFLNRAETLAAIGRTASSPHAFHYISYEHTVEAACVRDDLMVLMGSEITVSEGGRPEFDGKPISRRFTDVWRKEGGQWKKLARQSTITGFAGTRD
jgi:ketosteroid isomerase-like protein